MSFIQPCFIRKNIPELRKKLEELGYKPSYPIFQYPEVFKHIAACNFFGSKYYGVSDDEVSHHGEIKDAIKNSGMIDCGTNEELFLALAALRDDTDINQWFTNTNDCWYKCLDNKFSKETADWVSCASADKWHKATVEEIIKHFKDK